MVGKNLFFQRIKTSKMEKNTSYRYNPMQYTFYSIVNSSACLDQGSCAAAIARSFIHIHNAVEDNRMKNEFLQQWKETGEKIIVLKACDQRHLKYLKKELQYVAVATHSLSQTYGSRRTTLILTVFGRQDHLNKWLCRLPVLK